MDRNPMDAGNLVDRIKMLEDALEAVATIIGCNGCDCECEHHHKEHEVDCERCLACRVSMAIEPALGVER